MPTFKTYTQKPRDQWEAFRYLGHDAGAVMVRDFINVPIDERGIDKNGNHNDCLLFFDDVTSQWKTVNVGDWVTRFPQGSQINRHYYRYEVYSNTDFVMTFNPEDSFDAVYNAARTQFGEGLSD